MRKRGELMSRAPKGAMAAVVNLDQGASRRSWPRCRTPASTSPTSTPQPVHPLRRLRRHPRARRPRGVHRGGSEVRPPQRERGLPLALHGRRPGRVLPATWRRRVPPAADPRRSPTARHARTHDRIHRPARAADLEPRALVRVPSPGCWRAATTTSVRIGPGDVLISSPPRS
ncbi:hypothetical protein LV779_34330 [Streptomyces thinghirensis]|nr:hypothetical protein [Streptomyces thinghirensis]